MRKKLNITDIELEQTSKDVGQVGAKRGASSVWSGYKKPQQKPRRIAEPNCKDVGQFGANPSQDRPKSPSKLTRQSLCKEGTTGGIFCDGAECRFFSTVPRRQSRYAVFERFFC